MAFNKMRHFYQLIFQSASKFIPCSASCTSPNLPPNALNCLTRPSPAEIRLPAHQYTHFYTLPLAIQSCLIFPKEKRASSAPTDTCTPGMCVGQHCTANSFFFADYRSEPKYGSRVIISARDGHFLFLELVWQLYSHFQEKVDLRQSKRQNCCFSRC